MNHSYRAPRAASLVSLIATAIACQHEHPTIDVGATETDAHITMLPTAPGEAGGDEGADVTGGDEGGCFPEPIDGVSGVKYQCSLEYDVMVGYHVNVGGGIDEYDRFPSSTAQSGNDSTYEHPSVAACCTELDELPEDSCMLPHHAACFVDLVQHACYSVEKMMQADAESIVVGDGHDAILHAATAVADLRVDCFRTLWLGGDETCDEGDVCAMDFCTFAHDSFDDLPTWNAGISVVYGLATVSNIQMSLSTLLQGDVLVPLPDPADTCTDQHENDGVPPPSTSPGSVGSFLSPVADVPIDVVGPEYGGEVIAGAGEFSQTSELHRYFPTTTSLAIDYWTMVEEGPTSIGTSVATAAVDAFQLQLVGPETFPLVSGLYRLGAGAVLFSLEATVDGQGDAVMAHNKNTVAFYTVSGGVGSCPAGLPTCLVNRPFTIQYDDAFGDHWELDIPSTTWRP